MQEGATWPAKAHNLIGLIGREAAEGGRVTLIDRAQPNARRLPLVEQRFGV
ncbi:hypothetical protein PQR02_23335 [Paraburkholderia sediminicola]|uniref:Uncharacterized protein n=1 Tax=Paraburkholderia rhynchosiae TaxID=487049 RepID=A0ACC7NB74_9BURK